jgi:hypothetical protein
MGMRIKLDGLQLCDDCHIAAVNGDFTGLDYHYGSRVGCLDCGRSWPKPPTGVAEFCPTCESTDIEPMADIRLRQITAGLEKLGPHLVPNYDSDTGRGECEFSTALCDCCGTKFAGSRHEFAVLESCPAAVVTAVLEAAENDTTNWPGQRLIRYELPDGSWAWIPGTAGVGDTITV